MLKNNYPTNLFVISAPSGAGKSSLIKAYLNTTSSQAKVAISHTTRKPRPGEENGKHYFFVDKSTFKDMISKNSFIEYAHVFSNYYGTSRKEIEGCLKQGIDVFLDIDWQGAKQVRHIMTNIISIFILPPSLEKLEKRLINRGQDNPQTIQKRMQEARSEISHYMEYDYLIINDDFEQSVQQLSSIIQSQKLTVASQVCLNKNLPRFLEIDQS